MSSVFLLVGFLVGKHETYVDIVAWNMLGGVTLPGLHDGDLYPP